jgi:beta-lactamase regulating signal transducer with metallopeptidase domain
MRNFVAATMAAVLITSSAFAATDVGPLPAGKPAGVKQAQDANDNTVWWIVGIGVIAAGIALVASGNGNGNLAPGTVTTTTSSAASTSSTKAATTST